MRVLIIDRSIQISQRIAEQLGELSNVTAVHTSELNEQVFSVFNIIKPGAVLIGIGLAAHGVLDLLQQLKACGTKTIVIVLYLSIDETLRKICIDLGADYFIDLYEDFASIPLLIESLDSGKR